MKTLLYSAATCLAVFFAGACYGQESSPGMCKTDEMMQEYLSSHPEAMAEMLANEKFIEEWIDKNTKGPSVNAVASYTIPVVYHVYGTTQGGKPVNLSVVQQANDNWVNKDFNGLNSDYGTVHTQWISKRGTLAITFALAQKDPSGNPTNGVCVHPVKAGYGNGSGYDSQIAADAWDNYKYMNVYVMHDLYNDGVTNNSGVAWYPSTAMSNANTARVVYNGLYLGPNSWDAQFASTHTHEFGHWLNLMHTFQGGCSSSTNDNVSDTPPTDGSQGCHSSSTANSPLNCTNTLINAENYMDYNTSCYKMYTTGQITRMEAALQLPSRFPLWQTSNLINTGVLTATGVSESAAISGVSVYPNPASENVYVELELGMASDFRIEVTALLGNKIFEHQTGASAGTSRTVIDLSGQGSGVYLVSVFGADNNLRSVKKVVKH